MGIAIPWLGKRTPCDPFYPPFILAAMALAGARQGRTDESVLGLAFMSGARASLIQGGQERPRVIGKSPRGMDGD